MSPVTGIVWDLRCIGGDDHVLRGVLWGSHQLSVGVGDGVGSTQLISIGDGEGGMYAGAVHASVSVGGDLYFISRSK